MPPMHMSMVTFPSSMLPCCFFRAFTRSYTAAMPVTNAHRTLRLQLACTACTIREVLMRQTEL